MISPRGGDFVWETSDTAGTFVAFDLLGPVTVGTRTYSRVSEVYANGETVYYVRSQDVMAGTRMIFESGTGTYNSATNKIMPVAGRNSSNTSPNGSFVPVNFGAGTRDVVCVPDAASLVTIENLLAVLALNPAGARAALALGTAALANTGTSASTIPTLSAAYAGALADLTMLSNFFSGQRVINFTGGANNTICKAVSFTGGVGGVLTISAANGITASFTPDTDTQLTHLWCRGNDGNVYWPGSIVPHTGAGAFGTVYYLGNAGVLVAPPSGAPSTFNTWVRVGMSLGSGSLLFAPWPPFSVTHSSGSPMYYESGRLTF